MLINNRKRAPNFSRPIYIYATYVSVGRNSMTWRREIVQKYLETPDHWLFRPINLTDRPVLRFFFLIFLTHDS